ncbi:tetratricopeptide repeat-containing sensor histidine kinase [Pedobacter cryotolerans]|uniref:histidine kinase n=1 Tax=Pedobacter cryotolerans TaxID=2571270 RepID=A0A4U1C7N1_9SPHI|nr:sensor histidine kinase [Pedobacter cryotolerans]TKC01464.1 tetratricopeptide repeat protein [Pedobacter cryotolerans]
MKSLSPFLKSTLPIIISTLFAVNLAFSQTLNTDSLKNLIKTAKDDTTRAIQMRKLASYQILHDNKADDGLALLNNTEILAKKIGFARGICEVLLTRGNYHFRRSEWGKAIECFSEINEHADKIPDYTIKNRSKMIALNNLAGIYSKNGDKTTALNYYLKARVILEKLKPDATSLCTIYINIATHYSALNQIKKTNEYLNLCYPLLNKAKPYLKHLYWSEKVGLADNMKNGKMYKSYMDSLKKNLKTNELSDFEKDNYRMALYEMEGKYNQTYLKNIPKAISIYKNKLALAQKIEDVAEISYTNNKLGEIYYNLNDYNLATDYLKKANEGAKKDAIQEIVLSSSKLLSEIYYKQNKSDSAYRSLSSSFAIRDSLNTEKNLAQLNFLENGYQTEKKEKTIAQLKLLNIEKELAANQRNKLLLIVIISSIALLIILVLLYRSSRQKQIIADKDSVLKGEQIKFLERQQQVVSLQSMVNGQETERNRIAQDLHDGLGGLFSTIKMQLSTLKHEEKYLESNELFQKSYKLVDMASVEVRRIAHNMMPEVLIKIGLVPAIQELCNSVNAGKLLNVSVQAYGMDERLNASTEMMLFRIIQELLNNIIKHANATVVIIQFNREAERLSVTVEDNGRGFDLKENNTTAGLQSVKNRVDYLQGKLSIDSEHEVGTTVLMDFLINNQ